MPNPPEDGELEALLDYVHERRNFDFRGYKRASLTRRIFKRMQAIGVGDYQRYMEILEANPVEFAELFNMRRHAGSLQILRRPPSSCGGAVPVPGQQGPGPPAGRRPGARAGDMGLPQWWRIRLWSCA